jgi:hypothetical protein
MKNGALLFCTILLAGAALMGKFYTYEFVLHDDPTTGVAWRAEAAMDNGPKVIQPGSRILLQDENGFAGDGLYHAFAGGGWVLCFAAGCIGAGMAIRRLKRTV